MLELRGGLGGEAVTKVPSSSWDDVKAAARRYYYVSKHLV